MKERKIDVWKREMISLIQYKNPSVAMYTQHLRNMRVMPSVVQIDPYMIYVDTNNRDVASNQRRSLDLLGLLKDSLHFPIFVELEKVCMHVRIKIL